MLVAFGALSRSGLSRDFDSGGGRGVFNEGPVVDAEGNVFFTNIPAEQIFLWDPASHFPFFGSRATKQTDFDLIPLWVS
ncbi:MAG: hypothetical protein M2R45_04330 [Verrucomicrobia subdivision 3 bacterium]|nr:hypothetical protein [Limisphaerales bacterium]MCS1417246.1 hypothetical protein [Limisphaerales bacterium]